VSRRESASLTNSNSSISSSGSRDKTDDDGDRLQRGRATPAVLATSATDAGCNHRTFHRSVVTHQQRSEHGDSEKTLSRTEHIPGGLNNMISVSLLSC